MDQIMYTFYGALDLKGIQHKFFGNSNVVKHFCKQ